MSWNSIFLSSRFGDKILESWLSASGFTLPNIIICGTVVLQPLKVTRKISKHLLNIVICNTVKWVSTNSKLCQSNLESFHKSAVPNILQNQLFTPRKNPGLHTPLVKWSYIIKLCHKNYVFSNFELRKATMYISIRGLMNTSEKTTKKFSPQKSQIIIDKQFQETISSYIIGPRLCTKIRVRSTSLNAEAIYKFHILHLQSTVYHQTYSHKEIWLSSSY